MVMQCVCVLKVAEYKIMSERLPGELSGSELVECGEGAKPGRIAT